MGAIIKNGVLYTGGSSGSNQQADFAETDTTSLAYIKHKPTALSDFTNDEGFITNTVNNLINYYAKTESYTKTEVDTMISAVKSGRFIYVATLPATDIHTDAIYLVPKTISQEDNIKDEYINLDGTITGWEKIGDTKIDLSNYVQMSDTVGLLKNDGTVDTNEYAKTSDLDEYLKLGKDFNPKTWNGYTNLDGYCIWTDGDNIYYSGGTDQYVLDKSTNTWNTKTWNGLSSFTGNDIWTDGEDIYYSNYSTQYVLDKATSTWNTKTWNGYSYVTGRWIWADGENIYYSGGNSDYQYVLDKSTSTWNEKTWNNLPDLPYGNFVWTIGENVYFSGGLNAPVNYVLDKSTSTWNPKTWNGYTNIWGDKIWSDGENIYYSDRTMNDQCILDTSTDTWKHVTWNINNLRGNNIWTDGENIYFSDYSSHIGNYVLGKAEYAKKTDLVSKTENSVVGPVENSTTASQAYAVGEHFIRNDKFCTAIAAIASGATLTLNTNYVEGTIAENLSRATTYSSSETEIGTWLGQTLYRKVIDCGGLPNNSTKYVSAGIGSAIKVKHIYGTASANNNVTSNIPLPYIHDVASSYNVSLQYVPNGDSSHPDSIFIQTWANQTVFSIVEVVIEYTKS